MTRAAFVLALAGLTIPAGSVQSDPSYTIPMPSMSAPDRSRAESSPTDTVGRAVAEAPPDVLPATPKLSNPPTAMPATDERGRYSFHRMGDIFIRLDSFTGQVAQCGWAPIGWSCKAVADERAALDSEIARLQRENVQLKESLLSHGLDLPAGTVAQAPSQPPPVPPATVPDTTPNREPKGPSDVDLDRAIAFMKHVWRRLVDLMVDLQRDIQRKS